MSDFPSLKLQPGMYPCVVQHPGGAQIAGQLELAPGERPRGEAYGWPIDGMDAPVSAMTFPQESKYPVLHCTLQQGLDVLLIDATVHEWFPGRASLRADLAVVGLGAAREPAPTFSTCELQISKAHRVFGTYPIVRTSVPPFPESGEVDVAATIDVDADVKYVHQGTGFRCAWQFSSHRLDPFRFDVRSAPVFKIEEKYALSPQEWMIQHALPLRELVTLATLEQQQILWVSLLGSPQPDGRPRRSVQLFSAAIKQAPYAPSHDLEHDHQSLFLFNEIACSPIELIVRWDTVRTSYHSFVQPLMQGLTSTMDSRSRFLFLVQALEGLHTQTLGEGEFSTEEHRARRAVVLKAIKSAGVAKDDRAFLHRWLDQNGRYSLRERLEQLRDAVSGDIASFADMSLVPGVIPKMRNELSHGAGAYSAEELSAQVRAMAAIGVAHLLRLLGLPSSRIATLLSDA